MNQQEAEAVWCRDGLKGALEPGQTSGSGGTSRTLVLDDGRRVIVSAGLLSAREAGGYDLPLGRAEIDRLVAAPGEVVVPLTEERAKVARRLVETGRVRVSKTVSERSEVVDLPLTREQVDVERVAVNRIIEGPVEARRDGDTLIIPVVEEVLVVEKRLMLREEVRVTTRTTETRDPQTVTLRREEAVVERSGPEGTSG